MRTRNIAILIAAALLLSAALPTLAQINTDEQGELRTLPMSDPYQENYQPCTNARYRAWFGAS